MNNTSRYSIAATLLAGAVTVGCSSTATVVRDYCQVGSRTLPIAISRKDSLISETKRRIAKANATYERLCNAAAKEKSDEGNVQR